MSESWIKAIVLVCTFGAVLLAVETLIAWLTSKHSTERAINARMKLVGQGKTRAEALQLLRRSTQIDTSHLPSWAIARVTSLERLLTAARVATPTGQVLFRLIAAPVALFAVLTILLVLKGSTVGSGRVLMLGTISFILGAALPLMVLQFRANKTRKKMQDQFPVALDVFVRGLRAGHPIAAALDLLTVEMPDPIGSQFGIVVDEVTYGADLRDALEGMAERWDMDDMRMFVVCLSVQNETGGNLAEILENLSKVVRERASMMMKVRALSSEGRMTAVMLTVLPVFALVMLFLLNPPFYLEVADDPAFMPGFIGLVILYAIGFFTIRRMVDLKV
ncbi:MAG: type II secretion system F family protein [Sphingomicrobium sp.]